MSIHSYGDSPAPPWDLDDDCCRVCSEPLSRHDRDELCRRCVEELLERDADGVVDTEICPHCERPVVEERDHAEWCGRREPRLVLLASTGGPFSGGAL